MLEMEEKIIIDKMNLINQVQHMVLQESPQLKDILQKQKRSRKHQEASQVMTPQRSFIYEKFKEHERESSNLTSKPVPKNLEKLT
jgi:hypothetical protein